MPWMDSVKRGAARAAAEADRLVRLNRAEAAIELLRSEHTQSLQHLGAAAYDLFRQGRLPQEQLLDLAQAVFESEQRLREKEREIAEIRRETAAVDSRPVASYGHLCPRCRIRLPLDAAFCPECGGQAVDVARPISPPMAVQSEWIPPPAPMPAPIERSFSPAAPVVPAPPARVYTPPPPEALPPRAVEAETVPRYVEPPFTAVPPPAGQQAAAAPADPVAEAQPPAAPPAEAASSTPAWGYTREAPAQLRCQRCNTTLPDDALFCTECGARVSGRG